MIAPIIQPVIMAGGAGTRLWPVSRNARPKQFHKMVNDRTMLQETMLRVSGNIDGIHVPMPYIVTNQMFEGNIKNDFARIGVAPDKIILEPFGRNTAAVAAITIQAVKNPKSLVLLMPSDHHIDNPERFRSAVAAAAPIAAQGKILTFGISADRPHTGYGYIRQGAQITDNVFEFGAFVEKPDQATAQAYLDDGRYTWNAGIFLYSAKTMLAELEEHAPDILAATTKAWKTAQIHGFSIHLNPDAFQAVRSESIDNAVMEHTSSGAVYAPLDCGWNDIGSWTAVADITRNKTGQDPMVIARNTRNCHFHSDGKTLVTALGVEDLVIVAHEGAVLVARKDQAEDVKAIVETLKADGKDEFL